MCFSPHENAVGYSNEYIVMGYFYSHVFLEMDSYNRPNGTSYVYCDQTAIPSRCATGIYLELILVEGCHCQNGCADCQYNSAMNHTNTETRICLVQSSDLTDQVLTPYLCDTLLIRTC